MISPKICIMSLLFVCPLVSARVHLSTGIQFDRALQHYERTIEIQLDVNTPVIMHDNTMHLEIRTINEQEQEVFIEYAVFFNDGQRYYEQLASPALNVAYDQPAIISLGTTIGQTSEQTEYFFLRVMAKKI